MSTAKVVTILHPSSAVNNIVNDASGNVAVGGTLTASTITSAAATALTIKSAGTTAMTIDTSQNVGIGTTSPENIANYSSVTAAGKNTSSGGLFTTQNSDGTSKARFYTDGTVGAIGMVSNQPLTFFTNSAERMRIAADGTVWCGGTSFPAGTSGQINSLNAAGTPFAGYVNTTGGYAQIYFNNPNGTVGQIYTTGSTTTYATSSDYRLKHNVQSMSSGLSVISALKPVTYKWNADNSDGEGFIAHELQAIVPDAVSGEKDAVNEDGSIKPQGVDYSKIVVHLVAAIQELSAKNDALEARLAALEAK
jgi:hypothetical protein